VAVKIVTDTLSDIPKDMAEKLGITMVPLTVLFGHEAFIDRVTITTDEFYRRLSQGNIFPTTTQPAPAVFAEVYDKLSKETNEILVITLSTKLSGTYESAVNAKGLVKNPKCRVEVIDSRLVILGEGLLAIAAAKAAKKGTKLDELVKFTRAAMDRVHVVMYFDTLKYLAKGGRIGKAQGLLGSMLSVKPILTMREGEVAPVTRVRSLTAGMDYLYNFAAAHKGNIEELTLEHATTPDLAEQLADRLSAFYPKDKIIRNTVSPVVGTYAGPGVLSVAVLEAEKK
jgi:DegV family protein with EDD domain